MLVVASMQVIASDTNSSNYKLNAPTISSGGANTSSTNYKTNSILGTITGNLVSTLYKTFLGFFYSGGDTSAPKIYFVSPTPGSGIIMPNSSVVINVTINESNLNSFFWMWNYTNYSFYDNDLMLMYNFDNVTNLGETGSTVLDLSPNANNGILGNGTASKAPVWTTAGRSNSAFVFDGIDDYVLVQHSSSLDIAKQITVEAWVYPQMLNGTVIGKDQNNYRMMMYSDGTVNIRLVVAGGVYDGVDSTTATGEVTTGRWYHLAYTYNGTTLTIYINGTAKKTSSAYSGDITTNTQHVAIGTRAISTSNYYFNGTIDEVKIYNRSLTAAEIEQHYYSNLYKYNTSNWQFVTNQSLSRTGGSSFFAYQACAKDYAGTQNCTEIRNLTYTDFGCVGQNYVFKCNQNINESCVMNAHLNSSATCFNITADNVAMNCNGYSINYSTVSSGYGIYALNRSNITIANCLIRQPTYTTGRNIYLTNTANSSITNNSIIVIGHGSYAVSSDSNSRNNLINNNYIDGGSGSGSYNIHLSSNNNITLINNTINASAYDNGYSIYLQSSSNCTLINNSVFSPNVPNYVVTGSSTTQYNHSIDTTNLAEGLPVMYNNSLKNVIYSDQDLSATYGEVMCGFCQNVTYSNISFSYDGLVLSFTNYSVVRNSTFNVTKGPGILFVSSSNDNIIADNKINISTSYSSAIDFFATVRESVTNNDIYSSTSARGIYLQYAYGATNINITGNRINTNRGSAISYLYSYASNVSNNVIITNTGTGLYSYEYPTTIVPNYFYKNNITTNGTCIVLYYSHLHYFKETICNSKLYGLWIPAGANNTHVEGGVFTTQNHSIKIEGTNVNNNTFVNTILNSSAENHIFVNSTDYANEIFTNVSYNRSKVTVIGNVTLFFKWYVDVNVTDASNNPMPSANVSIYDLYSTLIFNGTTTSTGLIARQSITEYIKNSSIEYPYTNHTFNATNATFTSQQITANITQNAMINFSLNSGLPAKVVLVDPTNGNTTVHERRPLFIWQAPTGVPTYYEINISSNYCPNINAQVNAPTINYTPTLELCTKTEDNQPNVYYNWSVRACNAYGCGPDSDLWNFTIEPWVVITIVNDTVDFGNLDLGVTVNTTTGPAGPFILRNDGNVIADMINISANASLWTSPGAGLGTSYMQMVTGISDEIDSFNITGSTTDWVNIGATNQSMIYQMNYNDSKDSAYLHLQLTVPGDELAGPKETTLFFVWEQTP